MIDITEDEPFDARELGPALVDSELDEVEEAGCDTVGGLDAITLEENKPKVSVLCFSELMLDLTSPSSFRTLMLFQLPLRSMYRYPFPGFRFSIFTLLIYIVYGSGGGIGVMPPAHCCVPGASGSPASQRLRLTFMGDCGYWDPLPSASAAFSVLTT